MGWLCKGCFEFNKNDAAAKCEKCKGSRPQADKTSSAKAEGSSFPFKPPESKCPYPSTALQKLTGEYTLHYGAGKDVPGSGYEEVCPCQKHVNPDIVEEKVKLFKSRKDLSPSIPVFVNSNTKKLTIMGDGHHTFVAAVKSATPIILFLFDAPRFGTIGHSNWKSCTYDKFAQHGAAKKGTKMV